jgi:hypothetical protein
MIAYCNLALFMTNSTFNLTCADDGAVNEYVYVCIYICKQCKNFTGQELMYLS